MTDLASMFGAAAVPMEDGSFMSADCVRVAELIAEYDPTLELRWVRPSDRTPNQPAFAIVSKQRDGAEYVVFYVQDESQMNHTVLARLIEMDAAKQGNILNKIDAHNAAVKIVEARKKEDEELERLDIARSILKSPLHRYRHNGRIYE